MSPISIIAVVVLLTSSRARFLGPVFVLGWLLGVVVVGAIVLVVVGPSGAGSSGQRTRWVSWVLIIVGVLLLVAAVRHLRGRAGGEAEAPLPAWMGAIDRLNPTVVLGGGVVLGGVRPKSLLLVVGGAAAIAQTGIGVASRPSPTPSSLSSRRSALAHPWSSTSQWESGLLSCWVASRAGCAATTP